jgi:seryl-tRNA synthetase
LIQKVKEYDYQCKELQSQLQQSQNQYDEFQDDIGGNKQIHRIKEQLKKIK